MPLTLTPGNKLTNRLCEYSTHGKPSVMTGGANHVVEDFEAVDICIMVIFSVVLWNALLKTILKIDLID